MSNMVTILSYDNRAIKVLLDDKNKSTFGKKYPMFYNFKHVEKSGDVSYISAIDISLNAN